MDKERRILKRITKTAFQHPADQLTMKRLAENKSLEKLRYKLLTEGLEEEFYLRNLANGVRVSTNQCPELWQMLVEASSILDMETPALFIKTDPMPYAWSFGERKPTTVLTSGLIETMNDEELFAMLGHELGHIKCGHTLYQLLAENFAVSSNILSGSIPILGVIVSVSLQVSLLTWYRRSELSADRAALLTTQSEKTVLSAIMKLAGSGGTRFTKTLDSHEFRKQGDEFKEILEAIYKKQASISKYTYLFSILLQTLSTTNPWLAVRSREIEIFAKSNKYQEILNGNYEVKEEGDIEYLAPRFFELDLGIGDKYAETKGVVKDKAKKGGKFFKNLLKAGKKTEDTFNAQDL
jgi:Zn-dependent protease with chaperone function